MPGLMTKKGEAAPGVTPCEVCHRPSVTAIGRGFYCDQHRPPSAPEGVKQASAPELGAGIDPEDLAGLHQA